MASQPRRLRLGYSPPWKSQFSHDWFLFHYFHFLTTPRPYLGPSFWYCHPRLWDVCREKCHSAECCHFHCLTHWLLICGTRPPRAGHEDSRGRWKELLTKTNFVSKTKRIEWQLTTDSVQSDAYLSAVICASKPIEELGFTLWIRTVKLSSCAQVRLLLETCRVRITELQRKHMSI
jgi:hypothetical protein